MGLYTRTHQTLNLVLAKLGMQLIKYPPDPLNCRMRQIERAGVDLVLDVGANAGQHATMLRRAGYRGEIISFEPQPIAFSELSGKADADPRWSAKNVAVGAEPGTLTLNISENSVASSLLPIGHASLDAVPECRYVDAVEVEVVTLAETIRANAGRGIMLKIDVQGFEPQVLEGCGALLGTIALLDIEMSLVPIYENETLFDDMDAWIRARGFRRVGLDHAFWDRAKGELLAVDGIYARDRSE